MSTRYYFVVESARDLPKTDLIGGSDPIISVHGLHGGSLKKFGSTGVKSNTLNPKWNKTLFVEIDSDREIEFHLGDEDSSGIDDVGVAKLSAKLFRSGEIVELPFEFHKSKHAKKGKDARLRIKMLSYMKSANTLAFELNQTSNSKHIHEKLSDSEHRFIVPAPALGPDYHVAIDLEQDALDIKLLSTNSEGFLDMAYTKAQKTSLKRETYRTPKAISKTNSDFKIHQSAKLDDLTVEFDPKDVIFYAFDTKVINTHSLSGLVTAAGWAGAMGYKQCREKLKGVMFDDKEEEIVFNIPDQPKIKLVVDFDKGNVDCKVKFLEGSPNDVGAILTNKGDFKITSKICNPPTTFCEGKLTQVREMMLDDLEYGCSFNDMAVKLIKLENPRTVDLHSVIQLK